MKKILLGYLFFCSLSAKAEIWRFGRELYPMARESKTGVLISEKCEKMKDGCDAYKAVHNKQKILFKKNELSGGKSPGAVVCQNYLKAEVVILQDKNKNENAFCKFKDGSLASAGSLY